MGEGGAGARVGWREYAHGGGWGFTCLPPPHPHKKKSHLPRLASTHPATQPHPHAPLPLAPSQQAAQDFLNAYHSERGTWCPLSHAFNGQKGIARHHPELWKATLAELAVIHYTGGCAGRLAARAMGRWHLHPSHHYHIKIPPPPLPQTPSHGTGTIPIIASPPGRPSLLRGGRPLRGGWRRASPPWALRTCPTCWRRARPAAVTSALRKRQGWRPPRRRPALRAVHRPMPESPQIRHVHRFHLNLACSI